VYVQSQIVTKGGEEVPRFGDQNLSGKKYRKSIFCRCFRMLEKDDLPFAGVHNGKKIHGMRGNAERSEGEIYVRRIGKEKSVKQERNAQKERMDG
jgi:hypothetical protein